MHVLGERVWLSDEEPTVSAWNIVLARHGSIRVLNILPGVITESDCMARAIPRN